jgi:O-antigen/teichoic acid export membrane protein
VGAPELSSPSRPDPRSVFRNTVFSGLGEATNLFLFALGLMAPRYLAPEAFGAYTTAYSFIMIFRILPDLGMAYASTLEISREPSLASRLGSSLLGLQLVLAGATVLLCWAVGSWLYRGPPEQVVWATVLVLSLDLVLKTLKGTLRWLLKGLQHFGTETGSLVLERSLLLLLGWAALRKGYGAVGFALVLPIVRLPDTLGLWTWVDRFVVKLRPIVDPSLWKELLLKGIPFAYAGVMVTLLFNADKVILEHLKGTEEAGFYGVPVQILEGLTLIPRILSYALLPTMAALFVRAPGEVTGIYRRGLKYLLLVGLPIGVFGFLSSESFVPLLFGRAYLPSIPLARLLIPVSLLMFVSNFSETTLFCINRWRTLVLVSTIAVLVNVALALALVPGAGALGAAWARIAGEGAYTLMTAGALAAGGHRPGWLRLAWRPGACALVFGLTLLWLTPQGLFVSAGASSLLWVVATFVFGVWDPMEKELARGLVGRFLRP